MVLNGKKEILKKEINVKEFLATLEKEKNINLSGAVVLINDNVIKKCDWSTTIITDNDNVEVLSFVSGG